MQTVTDNSIYWSSFSQRWYLTPAT